MTVQHPRLAEWEKRLREIFDRIDGELEERHGERYSLHPARPSHGATSNPAYDGLFNVGAAFTAGYGSKHGRGYVVDVRMSTLDSVPDAVRKQLEAEVVARLKELLPETFPGRKLFVDRDGPVFKIHGDLSLGRV